MAENILKKLQADLTDFGLNPNDWSLHHLGGYRFQLCHKNEMGLTLMGYGSLWQGSWMWKDLILDSL